MLLLILHLVIKHYAEYDVGIRIDSPLNYGSGIVALVQGKVAMEKPSYNHKFSKSKIERERKPIMTQQLKLLTKSQGSQIARKREREIEKARHTAAAGKYQ